MARRWVVLIIIIIIIVLIIIGKKDITDKNRFRCRVTRSLGGTNFEYMASLSI